MAQPKLGKLVILKANEVWSNEPQVFTPWLAENLSLLADALQIGELVLKGTEVAAGDFRLDILAEDEDGSAVLIENQFGSTDHRHLGQLISYVASQNTKATVVWVAEKFKEDHRAAIDWLNRSTAEDFDFFGVEIEALRIGDSDPAPFFNVVSKPNNWARSISKVSRETVTGEIIKSHRIRLAYWTSFSEYLRNHDPSFRIGRPGTDNWYYFNTGRSGVVISVTISTEKSRISAELYFHNDSFKTAIRELVTEKDVIEKEFGHQLEWQELPGRKASRIAIYKQNVDPSDPAQYAILHAWMLDRVQRFRKVFSSRIKTLKLGTGNTPPENEESQI